MIKLLLRYVNEEGNCSFTLFHFMNMCLISLLNLFSTVSVMINSETYPAFLNPEHEEHVNGFRSWDFEPSKFIFRVQTPTVGENVICSISSWTSRAPADITAQLRLQRLELDKSFSKMNVM